MKFQIRILGLVMVLLIVAIGGAFGQPGNCSRTLENRKKGGGKIVSCRENIIMLSHMFRDERPRARTSEIVVQPLNEEILVYDLVRHKALSLNEISASVWNICDGNNTIAEIIRIIGDENVVRLALSDFERHHLLDTPLRDIEILPNASRRKMIMAISKGSIAALPIILSITAPMAIQSASCAPINAVCTASTQCCPGSNNTGCCRAGVCANGAGSCV